MPLKITRNKSTEPVYDVTVRKHHNFLADGIVAHNCSEILLHIDSEHTFVCCLSSLNLARFDEWHNFKFDNGMTLPELAVWFLDGVLEEFIARAKGKKGFEKAVRSAEKGRAIGIGVIGWHSYLQNLQIPFTGILATSQTHRVFQYIRDNADKASGIMAEIYGEPEWCEGTGRRHTHTIALAPTRSNSVIAGGVSASIEPVKSNYYIDDTAKGSFQIKNLQLEKRLEKYGKNDRETWKSIKENKGSVQHLEFLTDADKEVFKTFEEVDQVKLIAQAAIRQKYIDQTQSLNICTPPIVSASDFHKLHLFAWKQGIQTLYYVKTSSVNSIQNTSGKYEKKEMSIGDISLVNSDCVSCEG